MEFKRRTEISIEKTRRFVIRQPESNETFFCPACGEPMLAAETAAALFRVTCRRIYRFVEASAIHFRENEAGAVYVCWQSTSAAIEAENSLLLDEIIGPVNAASGERAFGETEI